jgi:hypothetical protein
VSEARALFDHGETDEEEKPTAYKRLLALANAMSSSAARSELLEILADLRDEAGAGVVELAERRQEEAQDARRDAFNDAIELMRWGLEAGADPLDVKGHLDDAEIAEELDRRAVRRMVTPMPPRPVRSSAAAEIGAV